ncbi:MAG: phosphodiester glycosidase family protein [bacterium]
MLQRLLTTLLLISALSTQAWASPKAAYGWNRLADGILYTTYSFPLGEGERSTIHAFQIDPAKYSLSVAIAGDERLGATAQEFANRERALLAINGGFFTPEHRSIGLIARDGKEIRPLHKTSWWSVFNITDGTPAISAPKDFVLKPTTTVALQVGPRLVIDGSIPKLKESVSARSAIGITPDGKIVIAITQGMGISMNELARRMSAARYDGGLGCPNAMALDGGSSSQLYAKIGKFELSLDGLASVTNAIVVKPYH